MAGSLKLAAVGAMFGWGEVSSRSVEQSIYSDEP